MNTADHPAQRPSRASGAGRRDTLRRADRSYAGLRLLLLAVALLTGACATNHVRTAPSRELTVHTFRRAYTNVHALVGPRGVILIDAGEADEAAALLRDLGRVGIRPKDVRAIILTHGHGDHAGGATWLASRTGATIVAGAGDVSRLASGRTEGLCATDRTAERRREGYERATFPAVTADVVLTEEMPLRAIADVGIDGRVLPLPGHTEGSLVIQTAEAVFVGDLLRGSIVGRKARRHFYMCDLDDNDHDVAALLDTLPPTVGAVFPGHFGPLTRRAVEAAFTAPGTVAKRP